MGRGLALQGASHSPGAPGHIESLGQGLVGDEAAERYLPQGLPDFDLKRSALQIKGEKLKASGSPAK